MVFKLCTEGICALITNHYSDNTHDNLSPILSTCSSKRVTISEHHNSRVWKDVSNTNEKVSGSKKSSLTGWLHSPHPASLDLSSQARECIWWSSSRVKPRNHSDLGCWPKPSQTERRKRMCFFASEKQCEQTEWFHNQCLWVKGRDFNTDLAKRFCFNSFLSNCKPYRQGGSMGCYALDVWKEMDESAQALQKLKTRCTCTIWWPSHPWILCPSAVSVQAFCIINSIQQHILPKGKKALVRGGV